MKLCEEEESYIQQQKDILAQNLYIVGKVKTKSVFLNQVHLKDKLRNTLPNTIISI